MRMVMKCSVVALAASLIAGCIDGGDPDTASLDEPLTASDPYFGLQRWHYDEASVPLAWNTTTGSTSTIVAVLDSGTMPHPDLNAKWVGGYDFFAGDANPHDDGWYHHGIHTAGTIAAVTNNGLGGAGVCWACRLMPMRVLSLGAAGNGDTISVMARAIRNAAGAAVADGYGHTAPAPAQAASVINISLGNFKANACPSVLQSAINAANAAGVVVVVAAGNNDDGDTRSSDYLWEHCAGVIVVSAADATGAAEPYAITGPGVTIAAPGGSAHGGAAGYGALLGCTGTHDDLGSGITHGVVSTWVTSDGIACYRHFSGTSMAAPHVSGIVALMKSRNPSVTPAQVATILHDTARPACGGRCGAGLVDASAAVRAALVTAQPDCEGGGGGRFSCIFDDVTGLDPLTVQWHPGVNVTFDAPGGNVNGVAGHCTIGTQGSVAVTVTDALGRSVGKAAHFQCRKIAN